jgi:hypothetical protein
MAFWGQAGECNVELSGSRRALRGLSCPGRRPPASGRREVTQARLKAFNIVYNIQGSFPG